MKANIYLRLLMVLVVAVLIAGCSAASKEDDKAARLEKLKQEHTALTKEIAKLEEDIAKENPDAATKVKAKEIAVVAIQPTKFDHFVQTQGRIESENNVM